MNANVLSSIFTFPGVVRYMTFATSAPIRPGAIGTSIDCVLVTFSSTPSVIDVLALTLGPATPSPKETPAVTCTLNERASSNVPPSVVLIDSLEADPGAGLQFDRGWPMTLYTAGGDGIPCRVKV